MAFHSKSAKQKSKISQLKVFKYLKMNLIIKVPFLIPSFIISDELVSCLLQMPVMELINMFIKQNNF